MRNSVALERQAKTEKKRTTIIKLNVIKEARREKGGNRSLWNESTSCMMCNRSSCVMIIISVWRVPWRALSFHIFFHLFFFRGINDRSINKYTQIIKDVEKYTSLTLDAAAAPAAQHRADAPRSTWNTPAAAHTTPAPAPAPAGTACPPPARGPPPGQLHKTNKKDWKKEKETKWNEMNGEKARND